MGCDSSTETNNPRAIHPEIDQQKPTPIQIKDATPISPTRKNQLPPIINAKKESAKEIKVEQAHSLSAPYTKTIQQREILQKTVNMEDDFVTHHLKYELSLTQHASKSKILKRQILQHMILQYHSGNIGGPNINILSYYESAQAAWLQRAFLDIWETGHDQIFNKEVEEKDVRRKIAEQYLFQLYQLKEFVDSGLGNISAISQKASCQIVQFMQYSDDALFHIFKKLKDRYPVAEQLKIEFPIIPDPNGKDKGKLKFNLLNNFPSKCSSFPQNINIQIIFEDVKFLLTTAIELQSSFKSDMEDIFGNEIMAKAKVQQKINAAGKPQFYACAVRKVFVQWAQNLLESCPDLKLTKEFIKFIKSKSDIANNFFFKSKIQNTSHKMVIDCLCKLIDIGRFKLVGKEYQMREQFIFDVYDLLQCRKGKNSIQDIMSLMNKMLETTKTKSGQAFEVIRIKNRLDAESRDVLINFRYGDILTGEVNLVLDDADITKLAKKNNQFRISIQQMEVCLFGPTLELMMQYEDSIRPDITIAFQAQNQIQKRETQVVCFAQKSKRQKCLHGHKMVSVVGNLMFDNTNDEDVYQILQANCVYCDEPSSVGQCYDECFQCGGYFCHKCADLYNKNYKEIQKKTCLSIQRQDIFLNITDSSQFQKDCISNNSLIVLFYLDGSSASQLLKDSMAYYQSKLLMTPNKFIPKIALANYTNQTVKKLCDKYKIHDFPTLILFNSKSEPVRTLIGFSWLEVPFLIETQNKILKGQSIQYKIQCAQCKNGTPLILKKVNQIQNQDNLFCYSCFGANKPINLPQQYKQLAGFCESGHYHCIACCYAALNIPTTYQDQSGSTYLSKKAVNPKLVNCPKGHTIALTKNNQIAMPRMDCAHCKEKVRQSNDNWTIGFCETGKSSKDQCFHCQKINKQFKSIHSTGLCKQFSVSEYNCLNCKKIKYFDNENGVGFCGECNVSLCPQCMGFPSITLATLRDQTKNCLVNHFVQSSAEEGSLCICQRNFKKTYTSRELSSQEMLKNNDGSYGCWKCELCAKKGKEGELHLACFGCPAIFQKSGEKGNLEICMPCAKKSKLLLKNPVSKIQEQPTSFLCLQKHKMIITSLNWNGRLEYECKLCEKKYCPYTERLYCKTCQINCCYDCLVDLWDKNPPLAVHKCQKGHELKFNQQNNKLQQCKVCSQATQNQNFSCSDGCNYQLCISCATEIEFSKKQEQDSDDNYHR